MENGAPQDSPYVLIYLGLVGLFWEVQPFVLLFLFGNRVYFVSQTNLDLVSIPLLSQMLGLWAWATVPSSSQSEVAPLAAGFFQCCYGTSQTAEALAEEASQVCVSSSKTLFYRPQSALDSSEFKSRLFQRPRGPA